MKHSFAVFALTLTTTSAVTIDAFDQLSIAEFQWIGSLQSNRIRSFTNGPPVKGYDWSKYSITYQLDLGIRGLDIDIFPCLEDNSLDCNNYIAGDTQFFTAISNCETIKDCVIEASQWSYSRKDEHFPLFIKIETESSFLVNGWTDFESYVALANVLENSVLQVYGNENPIFNYLDFLNLGGTWDTISLNDLRGKIIFYLTPGDTDYVLDRFDEYTGTEFSSTTNGWPDSLGNVFFSECNRRTFDDSDRVHCAIISNNSPGRITDIRESEGNRYIFQSNVDANFVQLEGYRFEVDENTGDVTRVLIGSTELTYQQWLYNTWFSNLQIAQSNSDLPCVITSETTIITLNDIPTIAGENANEISLCDIYDFVSFWNADEGDALNVVNELIRRNITGITSVEEFAILIYDVFDEVNELDSRLEFDINERLEDSIDRLNAPSNMLMSGFPFGTNVIGGIDESYKFELELGCNNTVSLDECVVVAKVDTVCLCEFEVVTESPTEEPTEEPGL